jgi:hypothetical protein
MRQRSGKLMATTPHRSSGDKILIRLDSSLARAVADFSEIGSQALAVIGSHLCGRIRPGLFQSK